MTIPKPCTKLRKFDPILINRIATKMNKLGRVNTFDEGLFLSDWTIDNFDKADHLALVEQGMKNEQVFREERKIPGKGRSGVLFFAP